MTAARWALLLVTNIVLIGVLGLYRPTTAAPPQSNELFVSATEQRADMIKELRDINAQLKEQNALFRAALKALAGDAPRPPQ